MSLNQKYIDKKRNSRDKVTQAQSQAMYKTNSQPTKKSIQLPQTGTIAGNIPKIGSSKVTSYIKEEHVRAITENQPKTPQEDTILRIVQTTTNSCRRRENEKYEENSETKTFSTCNTTTKVETKVISSNRPLNDGSVIFQKHITQKAVTTTNEPINKNDENITMNKANNKYDQDSSQRNKPGSGHNVTRINNIQSLNQSNNGIDNKSGIQKVIETCSSKTTDPHRKINTLDSLSTVGGVSVKEVKSIQIISQRGIRTI